jgi:hypothetical protein
MLASMLDNFLLLLITSQLSLLDAGASMLDKNAG